MGNKVRLIVNLCLITCSLHAGNVYLCQQNFRIPRVSFTFEFAKKRLADKEPKHTSFHMFNIVEHILAKLYVYSGQFFGEFEFPTHQKTHRGLI